MKIRALCLLIFSLLFMTAFVYGDTGKTEFQSGFIKSDGVNLRTGPGIDSRVIFVMKIGLPVTITEQSDDWFKVQLSDGLTGWINRQFVVVKSGQDEVTKETGSTALPINKILDFACSLIGTSYSYGGSSVRGFDCSGFTMYVLAKFGINLPHEASQQMSVGTAVLSMEDLVPGDLVFFRTLSSSVVNHVGIYIGDNRFIHASSGYGTVHISPLDSGYYYSRYAGGRRLKGNQPDETATRS